MVYYVEEKKIKEYLLNDIHPVGGSKSIFFKLFGFSLDNWEIFREALIQHGNERQISGSRKEKHGKQYEKTCNIISPDGRNPCIITVWKQQSDGSLRLITAFPKGMPLT